MEKPIKKYVMLLAALALSANAVVGSVLVQAEEPPSGVDKITPPEEGGSVDGETKPTYDAAVIAAFAEDLINLRDQLVTKQKEGYTSPDPELTIEGAIKYLNFTISQYLNYDENALDSEENRAEIKQGAIDFIKSLLPPVDEQPKPGETPAPEAPKPGENPKPEQPKPETPKPGETPKPEQPKSETPKSETPKQGETPKPEAPKEDKGNTSSKEAEATTEPEAQGGAKTLPATGETDSFAIFSAAALTILTSLGMLAYGKREEV